MNYLPTCTSSLVVQHHCHVSFKSMQGCRRSWEDKLKCVKILSVKDHNSAKICRTWIISPHALLDLWYNICTKFHSNPCKDVGGVEKTNFDVTEGRNDGRMDKANTKCPLAILWRGHNECFTGMNKKTSWLNLNLFQKLVLTFLARVKYYTQYENCSTYCEHSYLYWVKISWKCLSDIMLHMAKWG